MTLGSITVIIGYAQKQCISLGWCIFLGVFITIGAGDV